MEVLSLEQGANKALVGGTLPHFRRCRLIYLDPVGFDVQFSSGIGLNSDVPLGILAVYRCDTT